MHVDICSSRIGKKKPLVVAASEEKTGDEVEQSGREINFSLYNYFLPFRLLVE